MARGKQLTQLVQALRNETRRTPRVSEGVDDLPHLKQVIRRVQETLYDEYDWPHMRVKPTKALSAGQRFYDMPTDPALNLERIEQVAHLWGDTWRPIERGIGFEQYSTYNPDDDERADPVLRWDVQWQTSAAQLEVWPIPATAGTLKFIGIRALGALVSDEDTADLDDHLIVLFAAAEVLAASESADAGAKLAAAQARFRSLKKRAKAGDRDIRLGLGSGGGSGKPFRATVRVSG